MDSLNFEKDLKGILPPEEPVKLVVVIMNHGILNVELNSNHKESCRKESTSIIHFGPRFCCVNLHNGIDQDEISRCKQCQKTLAQAKYKRKTDEVSNEDMKSKIKEEGCNGIINHRKKRSKFRFSCDACSMRCRTLYLLKRHLSSKHFKNEKNFKCTICSETFYTNALLKSHVQSHQNRDGFICDRCGKKFKSCVQLKYHIQCSHFNRKKFACTYCRKKFCNYINLRYHIQIHMQAYKPFTCVLCKKLFRNYSHSTNHWLLHKDELFPEKSNKTI